VTKLQLHQVALTAGDEHAQDVQNVCDRGGVKILLTTPHRYEAGDTDHGDIGAGQETFGHESPANP
jgi:hypothetical protein